VWRYRISSLLPQSEYHRGHVPANHLCDLPIDLGNLLRNLSVEMPSLAVDGDLQAISPIDLLARQQFLTRSKPELKEHRLLKRTLLHQGKRDGLILQTLCRPIEVSDDTGC
jgi:hypothetical protein